MLLLQKNYFNFVPDNIEISSDDFDRKNSDERNSNEEN